MPLTDLESATADRSERLKRLDRDRARSEMALGLVLLLLGGLLLAAWATDDSGHGEIAFLWLGGMPLVLLGGGFLVSGLAGYLRAPGYRLLRWLPAVAVAVIVYGCHQLF